MHPDDPSTPPGLVLTADGFRLTVVDVKPWVWLRTLLAPIFTLLLAPLSIVGGGALTWLLHTPGWIGPSAPVVFGILVIGILGVTFRCSASIDPHPIVRRTRIEVGAFHLSLDERRLSADQLLSCVTSGRHVRIRLIDETIDVPASRLTPDQRRWLCTQLDRLRDRWLARMGSPPEALLQLKPPSDRRA